MAKNNDSSGGIGFFGLLAIVFITLKLLGVIAWSWLWGGLAFFVVFAVIYVAIHLLFKD